MTPSRLHWLIWKEFGILGCSADASYAVLQGGSMSQNFPCVFSCPSSLWSSGWRDLEWGFTSCKCAV